MLLHREGSPRGDGRGLHRGQVHRTLGGLQGEELKATRENAEGCRGPWDPQLEALCPDQDSPPPLHDGKRTALNNQKEESPELPQPRQSHLTIWIEELLGASGGSANGCCLSSGQPQPRAKGHFGPT